MLVKSRITSAEVLLGLSGDHFVAACYRSILWREPDPSGTAHHLARVLKGEDKLAIAAGIASSDEARSLSPGRNGLVAEILALHAESLISNAWTPGQRKKAARKISQYFSVISGSVMSRQGSDKSAGGSDADPFSNYYTSVIEGRNS